MAQDKRPLRNSKHKISKSLINILKTCKRWYYLAYVKEVPAEYQTIEAERGTSFHEFAANFFRNYKEPFEANVPRTDDPMIKNFIEFERARHKNYEEANALDKYIPPYIEVTVETAELKGVIDRIDIRPKENNYIVIDYKTKGSRSLISEERFEMSLYALLAEEGLGLDVYGIAMYYPKINECYFERWDEKKKESILKKLEKVKKSVGPPYQRKVGYHCDFCPYVKICLTEGPC